MKKLKQQLVLAQDDYELIMGYMRHGAARHTFNRQEAEQLETEIKKAKLVRKTEMPEDVVRLNSTVLIKEEKENKLMKLTVVSPEKADIRQNRISVMSPVGTALIGFRKGQKVSWKVPAGRRIFSILEVQNASTVTAAGEGT